MQLFAALPESQRDNILKNFSDEELYYLQSDWQLLARPAQLIPPGDWFTWLLRSGRGFGKTRTGSEAVIKWAQAGYSPIALVGQTKADARDTMIEIGDSSIIKVAPSWFMPVYEPSKRRLTFPNGSVCLIYSGDEPDQLRGPQHMKAWVDELAKFKYPVETWDNLEFGLRKGDNPQVICTTTPRPIKIIRDIIADSRTVETRGNTLDNAANLNPLFLERMQLKYQGTRLGRQELNGELLADNPDALWKRSDIDNNRVKEIPQLVYVVVGVDPAATSKAGSDDTGIIAAGKDGNGQYYVLGDYTLHDTPQKWGEAAITSYNKHKANLIIGETNNGGEMVENTIKQINSQIPFRAVHASRGKATRAEPVSALYEQGKVKHFGTFPELEDQLCEWVPGAEKSPDRLDALVWAISFLMNVGAQQYVYETNFIGAFSSGGMRI
ncbi:ATP-binding protein [Methanosarcina mazei]|uniref:ATP-binding protein n=2 Tax=Methanosarcina mazei TaxID=2209 RepID=A0A0F8J5N8_METMZ|nr:ATP-binding protein [Methanosarcina mazei]